MPIEALESDTRVLESGLVTLQLSRAFQQVVDCTSVSLMNGYYSIEMMSMFTSGLMSSDFEHPISRKRATRIVSAVACALEYAPHHLKSLTSRASDDTELYLIL